MPALRRLAAILAADVAGYSRLMGVDEEGTHERLQAHLRDVVDPKIRGHHGRIVKTAGDGVLTEFASVVDAVRCACEIQRAMAGRDLDLAEERRLRFRIGINLGDVIIDGNDIYGDGVNIAARLEALAEPSGICISRVVRDQIRDKLPYPFEDIGEQSVKNIARPVRAYAMNAATVASTPPVAAPAVLGRTTRLWWIIVPAGAIAGLCIALAGWWIWPIGTPPAVSTQAPAAAPSLAVAETKPPRLSIVVLPFSNLSNDPDQEYFADGITDDLTTDLSRISGSFVISRNTAFTYKGKPIEAKQVGRELGVRYVLEGSVRRGGEQVQVNAQLIDAETGAHVWAGRFEIDRFNLAKAQDEITGRLARTLNTELIAAAGRRIEQEKSVDPNAQDLVMRGRAALNRPFSAANRQEAQRLFERALEIEPQSNGARIGLAGVLVSNLGNFQSSSVQQDRARAEQLLLEALERGVDSSVVHYDMGLLRRDQNRLPEAQIEFETAITLDRNNAGAFSQLGLVSMLLGQPEAGIPHIEKAIRLNPHDPSIFSAYWGLGACHLLLGHLDEAIDLLRKARAANPRLNWIHLWLAGGLGLKGDLDEARAVLAEGIKLKPEVNSWARYQAQFFRDNPRYLALREKTLATGLRRVGFPDE
jgi:adenylate cyclase